MLPGKPDNYQGFCGLRLWCALRSLEKVVLDAKRQTGSLQVKVDL